MKPTWMFDEFKHIGVDFADPQQVAQYDARQRTALAEEQKLVTRLNIRPNDHVIEFGCGTGAFSMAAAMAGANVTAIDVSPAMLNYVSAKARDMELNIRCVHSGFLSFDEDAQADFIVTQFAFHHLPDFWKAVALHNMHRLLKPRGVFYLRDVVYTFETADYQTSIDGWIDRIAGDGIKGFSRDEFEMHVRDEFSTFSWILEEMLKREGFIVKEANCYAPTYAEFICIHR